jgi:hypothetical protein
MGHMTIAVIGVQVLLLVSGAGLLVFGNDTSTQHGPRAWACWRLAAPAPAGFLGLGGGGGGAPKVGGEQPRCVVPVGSQPASPWRPNAPPPSPPSPPLPSSY